MAYLRPCRTGEGMKLPSRRTAPSASPSPERLQLGGCLTPTAGERVETSVVDVVCRARVFAGSDLVMRRVSATVSQQRV
jgi:hypothetical protein